MTRDKTDNCANWIVLRNVVVQQFWQKRTLASGVAVDKAFHLAPVLMRYWLDVYPAASVYTKTAFLHGLGQKRTFNVAAWLTKRLQTSLRI